MRIIAGRLGGRTFDSPRSNKTHPMSEKMRGAIFNLLGDLDGLIVLDAFAGSGALGLEAISRRASHVTFIDNDKNAFQSISSNIQNLSLRNSAKATKANINSWLDNNSDKYFDVIFCDPPYDDVRQDALTNLANQVKTDGIIVYSLPPNSNFTLNEPAYRLAAAKSYGDAILKVYKKN